jgi:hypothetical protein
MTKDMDEAPDKPQDELRPQPRGGAADVDRAKGLETDPSGTSFGSPKEGTAEPRKEVPDGETP